MDKSTTYRKKRLQEQPTLCVSCLKRERTSPFSQCSTCIQSRRNQYRLLKLEVFNAYGGPVCACCGETEFQFLCIDHVNNNRPQQCLELGWKNPSSSRLYSWLKRNGFPPGYQILCWNCNRGKWSNGGICPHKKGVFYVPS